MQGGLRARRGSCCSREESWPAARKALCVQSSAACAATIGPCPLPPCPPCPPCPPEAALAADPDSLELGRKGQGNRRASSRRRSSGHRSRASCALGVPAPDAIMIVIASAGYFSSGVERGAMCCAGCTKCRRGRTCSSAGFRRWPRLRFDGRRGTTRGSVSDILNR